MPTTPGRPYCTVCMDDAAIEVLDYRPAHKEPFHRGDIHRYVDVGPAAYYRCRCGNEGWRDVSAEYVPPFRSG